MGVGMKAVVFVAAAIGMHAGSAMAEDEAPKGTWLVKEAGVAHWSDLSSAWGSTVAVGDGTFTVSHFCGTSKDLRGKAVWDAGGTPGNLDLTVESVDVSEKWPGVCYPAARLQGIYKEERGELVVCFRMEDQGARPRAFVTGDRDTLLLRLVRANKGFTAFPKEVAVTVLGPDGKPDADAVLVKGLFHNEFSGGKGTGPGFRAYDARKVDGEGRVSVPYEGLANYQLEARDEGRHWIGVTEISPASLQDGKAVVRLEPEVMLTGKLASSVWKVPGVMKWTNVYVMRGGMRLGGYSSLSGEFSFPVTAGDYLLDAYGEELPDVYVPVHVPAGIAGGRLEVPTIELKPSRLVEITGKRAPALENVVAWRGEPVDLAGLKGKVVLLHFWGYWCGPCVEEMPMWMALAEKFKDRGVAVVGVHQDLGGEVGTVAAYEQKIAGIKKKLWKGKEPEFPMALTSGKREGALGRLSDIYGVQGYPTTIAIGRDGKVVGRFDAGDEKEAEGKMEKLLGK